MGAGKGGSNREIVSEKKKEESLSKKGRGEGGP